MKFRTLLADPPWRYRYWSENGEAQGCAAGQYEVQTDDWILSLPVAGVAEKDATLLLWATNPHLPLAFRVVEAWGFTYKTMLTWVKMSRATAPRLGIGHHARGATEHLIIGQAGQGHAPDCSRRPLTVFFSPIGRHSAKPDYQYDIAEGYGGPYLELFARPKDGGLFGERPGWVQLGNEMPGCGDIVDDLRRLAEIEAPPLRPVVAEPKLRLAL